MKMRFAVFVGMITALTGCVIPGTLVTKPKDGYPALRFMEPVRILGPGEIIWEFRPGDVLVGDRATRSGQLLYCGYMEASGQRPVCVIKRDSKLIVTVSGDRWMTEMSRVT